MSVTRYAVLLPPSCILVTFLSLQPSPRANSSAASFSKPCQCSSAPREGADSVTISFLSVATWFDALSSSGF